ncbi:MAG: hypothetical protein F6K31_29045 [Symploca sp. SIO2G7]|nr:hypothetical protein [Symploca sp. SIO2G7]
MSSPRKPPAYLRYFKARLKPLGRPGVWASMVGLVLVLVATGYYWQHPELLQALSNNQATDSDRLTDDVTDDPTLSSEELAAIMADIDSSSVLLAEFDSTRALSTITQPNQKSDKKKPESLFSEFIPQQGKTDSPQKLTLPILNNKFQNQENDGNPFTKSTQELTNSGLVSGNNFLNNPLEVGLLKSNQSPSQNSSSLTTGTVTTPNWDLNSPNVSDRNQGEVPVNPPQIPATNSLTAADETSTSDNQQEQVSQPTFPYTGQTSSSPVSIPSPTKFPRSRPRTSTYSNPYNSSVPSPSIPSVPTALPVTPVTPVVPGNYGQYSTQPSASPNIVPDTESKSTFGETGLKPSQLDESEFDAPGN